MKGLRRILYFVFTIVLLSSCNLPGNARDQEPEADTPTEVIAEPPSATQLPPTATLTETPIPPTATYTVTASLTSTQTPSLTPTPFPTNTPTATATETFTLTASITPTYAIFRGKVIPERANCRYGPGAAYLYKYGLVGGSNLEIIGRDETGTWVLIQAIGGDNPCWVKAEMMELKGDILTLEPLDVQVIQAWSPYYGPLTNVSAQRDEEDPSKVTVFWSPLVLRAGDDAEQVPYVIEAWICEAGEIVFKPIAVYEAVALVIDEPGCEEPSHARVLGAEKHGYTAPAEIPWP